MNIETEARAREYAIKHGAINLQQIIEWADSMIKSSDDPAVELFDISLAKTMSDAISGLNRLGGTGYSPEAAKRVFYFFYQSLQSKDVDFERISRGLYDMALSEFAPSEELIGEMMTYWDGLDLAELGHYGDPVEIKKDMLNLLHNNMV